MTEIGMSMESGAEPGDGRRDFDFLMGTWTVHHRRLRRRLSADRVWEEFGGTCAALPVLGGAGNVDDNVLHLPGGSYRALSIRAFDACRRQWSIWWLDAREAAIGQPVHGRFEDGVGTFLGDDVWQDRPVRVRFLWSGITDQSARWEQAFSADGGATYETNWVMDFRRAP
jgi:hypothetical protein